MATSVGSLDWWITIDYDLGKQWAAQPTYLISQAAYLMATVATLIHALNRGGRWPYFWVATVIHGVWSDNFWHFAMPDFDNFWHSQTPIMLLGQRMPLHIVFLYTVFIYQAAYGISKLKLPRYAEPFAVSLMVILIDMPYDITAVKFVHWTWHDTDPNIYDRNYWVPWNSYYFHGAFTLSFMYFFHASRRWFAPKPTEQWEASSTSAEVKAVILSSILGMPGGVLLFVPIYHPLHDMHKIHTEVTFFMLFMMYAYFVLRGLLAKRERDNSKLTSLDYLLILMLVIHYAAYWCMVVFFNPEDEVSKGLHEPVGPCHEKASLITPFGQTLYKRKYLCVDDYDEKYFDFHCVPQKPGNGSTWYTICGTPFENRAEYITIISAISLFAAAIFHAIYFIKDTKQPQKNKQKRQ